MSFFLIILFLIIIQYIILNLIRIIYKYYYGNYKIIYNDKDIKKINKIYKNNHIIYLNREKKNNYVTIVVTVCLVGETANFSLE